MFLGINMFWLISELISAPPLAAQAQMSFVLLTHCYNGPYMQLLNL